MMNNETNSQFVLKYKGNGFKACDKHPDLQNPSARGSRLVNAIPRNMMNINLLTGSTSFSIPSVPLNKLLVWFSNRTGTSVDNGARKSNNWLDQWQSGKLGTGSRVYSFPLPFPLPTDVPVMWLNQPNYPCQCLSTSIRWKVCDLSNLAYLLFVITAGFGCPVVPDV